MTIMNKPKLKRGLRLKLKILRMVLQVIFSTAKKNKSISMYRILSTSMRGRNHLLVIDNVRNAKVSSHLGLIIAVFARNA